MKGMSCRNRTRQSGAVLIVSMVLLVILTMLGVTAMNTTSLQERMASNTQQQVHAFQAAETGLNLAFTDRRSYDTSDSYKGGLTLTPIVAGSADRASYVSSFLGFSSLPPGQLFSATSFHAANFNFRATGNSATNLSITLNGGAYQIAPKQ